MIIYNDFSKFSTLTISVVYLTLMSGEAQSDCIDNTQTISNCFGWNWELDKDDPNYCKTWTAYFKDSENFRVIGAPWEEVYSDGTFLANDIKKIDGWVLLARDFGLEIPSHNFPWFILYNKHQGIMRLFVFLGRSEGWTHVIAELTHPDSNPGANTSILSHAQELMLSPEEYLKSNIEGEGENIIYNSLNTAPDQWARFDFTPTFEPFINSEHYMGSNIDINIFGLVESSLIIEGSTLTKDASFSSKSKSIAKLEKLEKVEGILKKIGKADNAIKDANKWADSLVVSPIANKRPFIKDFAIAISELTSSEGNFSKIIGAAAGLAQASGGIAGFIGSTIKFFSPKRAVFSPPKLSTHQLSGEIKRKIPLRNISINVPGTQKAINSEVNNPNYDCPLGVFNLKSTPVVNKFDYTFDRIRGRNNLRLKFKALKVRDNLNLAINPSSELDLIKAEAAIVGRVELNEDSKPSYDLLAPHEILPYPFSNIEIFNPMLADIEAGRMIISYVDSETEQIEFQTPFVDINCFKDLAINVHEKTEVFIRVRTLFKRESIMGTFENYQFVHDYRVRINDMDIFPDNPIMGRVVDRGELPPFSNYTIPYNGIPISNHIINSIGDDRIIEATHSLSTEGNLIITRNYENAPLTFRAGNSVTLLPGFEVKNGSNFLATTDYGYFLKCTETDLISINSQICSQQNYPFCNHLPISASRPISPIISVYPNPTIYGEGIMRLNLPHQSEIKFWIKNLNGVVVMQSSFKGKFQEGINDIPFRIDRQLPSGIYVCNVELNGRVYTYKVVVKN